MSRRIAKTAPTRGNPLDWIVATVHDFWSGPENDLAMEHAERAWDVPRLGFANGADPIWGRYKDVVGPFHWTPEEIFTRTFPEESVSPERLTVIVWILPQTEATKRDQRTRSLYPAERWARSRIFGERFNHRLRRHVARRLTEAGYPAVAPMETPQWEVRDSEAYVYASTWSERHAAYAAGLGTFGLCDGLITPKGKAVRVGSVVARLEVPASPRPYTDHHAYCLFYAQGTCGDCIDKCPVSALSDAGHDKRRCRAHLDRTRTYVQEHYGFEGYGCGLCQIGVPCESGIPEDLKLRH
jgi:epoxyqueuosine reductase QueG